MIGILLIVILAWASYSIATRGSAFLDGFAGLLDRPVRGPRGPRTFLSGREFVGGEHAGRAVSLFVQQRRNSQLGYLVLGVATRCTDTSLLARSRAKEALDALASRYNLSLELDGGWLKATWMPIGIFIFPGRFDEERWRTVLDGMEDFLAELEAGSPTGAQRH
jgi:hypothetical protein